MGGLGEMPKSQRRDTLLRSALGCCEMHLFFVFFSVWLVDKLKLSWQSTRSFSDIFDVQMKFSLAAELSLAATPSQSLLDPS